MGLCWSTPSLESVDPSVPSHYVYTSPSLLPSQSSLLLHIQMLSGVTLPVWTSLYETVGQLKLRLQSQTGIPPQHQIFLWMGQTMKDDWYLSECSIQSGDTIYLVFRII